MHNKYGNQLLGTFMILFKPVFKTSFELLLVVYLFFFCIIHILCVFLHAPLAGLKEKKKHHFFSIGNLKVLQRESMCAKKTPGRLMKACLFLHQETVSQIVFLHRKLAAMLYCGQKTAEELSLIKSSLLTTNALRCPNDAMVLSSD